jgi:hypothetical protein
MDFLCTNQFALLDLSPLNDVGVITIRIEEPPL